jgi:hypothetical protein
MFVGYLFRLRPAILLLLACMTVSSAGCGTKELNRSHAAGLIRASEEFKKGAAVRLLPEYRQSLTLIGTGSKETSKEEFALRRFLESHADLAVLNHLGLVDFKVRKIEYPDSASSPVTVGATLTDNGRSASGQWLPSGDDWIVPLAQKELVEVTGLTGGEGESKQARADYTWKWQPTSVGASFDTSGQAFQNLPDSIRRGVGGASFADMLGSQGQVTFFDGSKTQKASATLQLYDDGWRISDR